MSMSMSLEPGFIVCLLAAVVGFTPSHWSLFYSLCHSNPCILHSVHVPQMSALLWTHRMATRLDNNTTPPAPLFFKIIRNEENAGNKIVSDRTKRNGSKVIIFKDGGKLVFKKSGFLTREFADGKKIIYSPVGKRQVVCLTCTRRAWYCVPISAHYFYIRSRCS